MFAVSTVEGSRRATRVNSAVKFRERQEAECHTLLPTDRYYLQGIKIQSVQRIKLHRTAGSIGRIAHIFQAASSAFLGSQNSHRPRSPLEINRVPDRPDSFGIHIARRNRTAQSSPTHARRRCTAHNYRNRKTDEAPARPIDPGLKVDGSRLAARSRFTAAALDSSE
jgi:hypothetical protein